MAPHMPLFGSHATKTIWLRKGNSVSYGHADEYRMHMRKEIPRQFSPNRLAIVRSLG
jgi:hypothetical protein